MRDLGGLGRPRSLHWLQRSLEAVRDDDAVTAAPPELYVQVMRAWDGRLRRRTIYRRARLSCAAVAVVAFSLWWVFPADRSGWEGDSEDARITRTSPGQEPLLATDTLIDEASSVQYVRLSVTPQAMAAFGIPVLDAPDGEPVAVEALVGLDGVPRAIRYAPVTQESR